MAKKKEAINVQEQNQKAINPFDFSSIGEIAISLMRFALPEVSNGAIKVNDNYFDAKTGFTVIDAEACGSEVKIKYNLHNGTEINVTVKSENSSKTFQYSEKEVEL
jgi:hypothetical protein